MNIVMVGIDHNLADIFVREKFSFTNKKLEDTYDYFREIDEILGSVIISTCNRSEIYFSLEEESEFDPFVALCKVTNTDYEQFEQYGVIRTGEQVFEHLCLLSCGAKSKIWGEDQVISQVKTALTLAREQKMTDAYLEVLFRFAVGCAKEVKTLVKFGQGKASVAYKVMEQLEHSSLRRVLVIGNGEIGRLVATLLIQHGFQTTMTLRQYKHSNNIVPEGCAVVNYEDRYHTMEECDIVVSATSSPHYTVEYNGVKKLRNIPKAFFDLAVPRDIEDKITEIEHIQYFNIDSLEDNHLNKEKELEQIQKIIEKHDEKLQKWCQFKERVCV